MSPSRRHHQPVMGWSTFLRELVDESNKFGILNRTNIYVKYVYYQVIFDRVTERNVFVFYKVYRQMLCHIVYVTFDHQIQKSW